MPSEPRISCRHIWKVFCADAAEQLRASCQAAPGSTAAVAEALRQRGCVPAVCDVSFDVRPGEIFVIMGLSGSGKSTVVRCLSRLIEPTAGEVLVDGQNIVDLSEAELIELRRHRMGMVFQNFGLMPHMTVLENVAYPLRVQGVGRAERLARARETIELVSLAGREHSYPRELSGGMQQRVGIARSLAVKPDVWFLDEPFSALDPLIRRQMQDEFLRLQSMLQKSIVFITHDFLEALRLADRIAIMRGGEVVQIGTAAELVLSPADDYVADFTREVPREKIVTARDILEPAAGPVDAEDGVPAGETLDGLLQRFCGRREPLPIVDEAGRVLGRVTLDRALGALRRMG
ncbi:betaine/proline/choline family ABC transporter ATP-binding protein [Aurantimonas sp. C2-6-R+9]|uniref:quaternary amine ABC transporter ATP-binding protein n=1 Tax=unclassified Aurantimonas TaxID=2638230 RepID=UPI002E17DE37|nr:MULTISPECIES: betaine/proline/choline family ABC transporter ATP-binding protein [unclassified Aurantimonas]MEC5293306.1 betaine/proline/choline family ABC transporter ATP-binding protein [Aurantimonas sp. C2-3-R2]MEC5324836.1 betaine/proline/choline family ABC transporter ATP-binding protein [Aurantimonas sp. A3-2-R12]MEC5383469.1 betaine/proline/choline family ABC transporter ATP-binding protein [Aurantimonas sp. C2-6-R+9]MEC5414409.1 betaine/proline/choline family ABC transporter ATP-bind